MTARVTAILVTFNSAAVIGRALASLPAGTPAIVVDNASADDSAAIAESAGAAVIRLDANVGFGKANNVGLGAARTEFVAFVNPDAALMPGCLDTIIEAAAAHPEAALFVPAITTSKGLFEKHHSILTPKDHRFGQAAPGVRRIGFASGGVLVARRAVLDSLGGFDEAIFLYFEDDDLSRRVIDAGHGILLVEGAQAEHAGNVSSPPSDRMIALKHWHLAWSERHVRLKHRLPVFSRWRIMESLVKLGWALLRRDRQEIAKQRGLLLGTVAALRGVAAQDVRDRIGEGRTA